MKKESDMSKMSDGMITFLDENEIHEMITELAHKINRDYANRELVLICPLKGSFLFMADLMRKLTMAVEVDFVHVTSPKGQSVRIIKDVEIDLTGKDVLFVEEIIDAGRTLSFLKRRLLSSDARSVKIVTLLDKPARRELPIKPDYSGKTIDDRFVVGYGMDSEEVGRNYKKIYNLAQ